MESAKPAQSPMLFRPSLIPPMKQQHMFDPKAMFYWEHTGANYPTQLVGKLLAVKTFQGETFGDLTLSRETEQVRGMLQEFFPDKLSYTEMVNLLRELYQWAEQHGLPEELRVPGQTELWVEDHRQLGRLLECDGWWAWLYPQIGWDWIAGRIAVEFEKNYNRREDRALELYWGRPKERLETWECARLYD